MCDVQLFNGLGILISGFISMNCSGLQAYQWQIIVYLAWFSSVTHLSGLTVLRHYLVRRPIEAYIRYTLMVALLIVLIVAIVPTGFFNWVDADLADSLADTCDSSEDEKIPLTAAQRSSPAICFLDMKAGSQIFDEVLNEEIQFCSPKFQLLEETAAFQFMIVSIVLLVFGFASRSIRIFKSASFTVHMAIRQPISIFAQTCLLKLAGHSSRLSAQRSRRVLVVNPCLATFLMLKLNFDLFSSMLAEV